MSLEVQVREVKSHLLITAEGQCSFASLCELSDRVKTESEKRARQGAILDVSKVAGTISLMDMFALGERFSTDWKLPLRIALISPEVGIYNFFEHVATNQGVQIAVVANQAAAIEWLR